MSEKRAVIDFSLMLCDAQVSQQLLLFFCHFFFFSSSRMEDMKICVMHASHARDAF
jgi:hypothetical protein